ncbi:MAG: hypothetical protein WBW48_16380 [Anaerolineae bacterium]
MTYYVQETDSRMVYPRSPELHYFFSDPLANATFGGYSHGDYFPLASGSNLLQPAWGLSYRLANRDIANEAGRLLSVIQKAFFTLQELQLDLSHIPQLRAYLVDDGSVLFEWIFNDYRVGFSIDPNPQESGWYLITRPNLGGISASGFISGIDLDTLIMWLLNFIMSHS